MYKYNSNINYQPNGGDWPGLSLDLHKQKIYLSTSFNILILPLRIYSMSM